MQNAGKDKGAAGGRMRLGLCTYLVAAEMDLPTLIAVCEQSGMEGMELRTTHAHGVEPSLDAAGRARVGEALAKTSVRLHTLGTACEFHSPDRSTVEANIAETRRFIDLAAELGAVGVKVRPNDLPEGVSEDGTLRQIGRAVRECGEFARDKGIALYVECHGRETQQPARMAKIMEHCGHPAVGLCWNCNAVDVQDGSIRENFRLCQAWIRHVHIHTLTGDEYPWEELFGLLKGIAFDGYTMIETKGEGEPAAFLTAQRDAWEKLVR